MLAFVVVRLALVPLVLGLAFFWIDWILGFLLLLGRGLILGG